MNVNGKAYRTIWTEGEGTAARLLVIDQRVLPHVFSVRELATFEAVCEAIRDMTVRGAGLIGATAAYGMWMAMREGWALETAAATLMATRPTAANLASAVTRQVAALGAVAPADRVHTALAVAVTVADEDAAFCRRIGEHGLPLIRAIWERNARREPVRVLTHCNAGWLAFVDHGSALAPVYAAHAAGIPVEVWVDETRPRNQGAALTAWELGMHGVPHTLIADNAGGHLMREGLVDMVITGADRVARNGDAANKIGTYLKALAAADNQVPLYVALPSSTFDFALTDGGAIPIEERGGDEVRRMQGIGADGVVHEVRICPESTPARNWAFDVTPARLITGLICERGVCAASEEGIGALFPDQVVSPLQPEARA